MTQPTTCGHEVSEDEAALGWPIHDLDRELVCPSCYGDEAFCQRCGALLQATSEASRCDTCAA
jgi:hypothetical protein